MHKIIFCRKLIIYSLHIAPCEIILSERRVSAKGNSSVSGHASYLEHAGFLRRQVCLRISALFFVNNADNHICP